MDFCEADGLKLDYLNGLLSEKDGAAFERHLAGCPACRSEIDGLRQTAAAVAGLPRPSVPEAWAVAVADKLRAKAPSPVAAAPARRIPAIRRGSSFRRFVRYALSTAGVTAGLAVLFWLVIGGAVRRWLPGLSSAALEIAEPSAARTLDLVVWILSLHALLLVPSIIDNLYRLVAERKSGGGGGGAPVSANSDGFAVHH